MGNMAVVLEKIANVVNLFLALPHDDLLSSCFLNTLESLEMKLERFLIVIFGRRKLELICHRLEFNMVAVFVRAKKDVIFLIEIG